MFPGCYCVRSACPLSDEVNILWACLQALSNRGLHPAYQHLERQFQLQDRRTLQRLARTLSNLAHWAPVFGEVGFLPAMAFPFVKLYGAKEEACFEVGTADVFSDTVLGPPF